MYGIVEATNRAVEGNKGHRSLRNRWQKTVLTLKHRKELETHSRTYGCIAQVSCIDQVQSLLDGYLETGLRS